MKKKMISLLLCLTLAVTALAACGSDSDDSTDESNDDAVTEDNDEGTETDVVDVDAGTLTYAIAADNGNTLNPITEDGRYGLMMLKYTYTQLYVINADGSVTYKLAESLEASDDGLTYTLKLKDGLVWSDGEPLTAEDVVFTFDSYNEENTILYIDGEPFQTEALDELTVQFTLPSVSASFEEMISAEVWILPKHYYEELGTFDVNLLEEQYVSSGAYTFEEYVTGSYYMFTKNENYYDGEAGTDTLVLQVVESDDTAKLALQNGEIQVWQASAASAVEELEGNDAFTLYPYSEGRVAYMRLNRASENMQDKDFRQGILYALNKEEILVAAYTSFDYTSIGYSFLPDSNEYYTEDLEKYEQDTDKAAELIAASGMEGTTLKICYLESDDQQTAQALVIQAQLKEVGIDVELNGVDSAAWSAAATDPDNGDYDMFLGGYIMTTDPNGYATLFDYNENGILNYKNDEIDELFNQGNLTLDKDERAEIYTELQQKVADEALLYPLGSNYKILAVNSNLSGVEEAQLVGIYTFEDISQLSLD